MADEWPGKDVEWPGKDVEPTVGEDIRRSTLPALQEGVAGLLGGGVSLAQFANPYIDKALEYLGPKLGFDPKPFLAGETKVPYLPSTSDIVEKMRPFTGIEDYRSQTGPGQLYQGMVTAAPGALTGGFRSIPQLLGNLGRFSVAPTLASEGASKAAQYLAPDMPGLDPWARLVAGGAAAKAASRGVTPNPSQAPEASRLSHAAQVETVERELGRGVVSAGERADNKAMRQTESELDPEAWKRKLEASTRAASRQVGNGRGGNYETPIFEHGAGGNIDTMFREVGNRFDTIQGRNTMHYDAPLGNAFNRIENNYTDIRGTPAEVVNAVRGPIEQLRDMIRANGGIIPGDAYQRFRSNLNRQAMSGGPASRAQHDIVDAIDDAMERSIRAGRPGTNPADAGAFPEARHDFKAALVLEKAVKASNVTAAKGYASPAKIEAAASDVYGSRAHQRGQDPFYWAPAAKGVLVTEPDSGTAGRLKVHENIKDLASNIGGIAGLAGGMALGHATGGGDFVQGLIHGGELGTTGLLAGLYAAGPRIAPHLEKAYSAYVRSGLGNLHRGNQALAGTPSPVLSYPGLLSAANATQLSPLFQQQQQPPGLLQQ